MSEFIMRSLNRGRKVLPVTNKLRAFSQKKESRYFGRNAAEKAENEVTMKREAFHNFTLFDILNKSPQSLMVSSDSVI